MRLWLSDLLAKASAKLRPVSAGGSLPWAAYSPSGPGYGLGWVEPRHEQVRHFRHWVYVALARICDAVAQQIPTVSVSRGLATPGAGETRRRGLVAVEQHERLDPVPPDHPLVELLRTANPEDTGFDLWYETVMYLGLTGLAYWWCPRNNAGRPCELWVLPTHWVWPVVGRNGLVESYQLRPSYGAGPGASIPAGEVVRFRRKSPLGKWDGHSPLAAGSRWVDAAESVDKTRFFVFRNGPMPQLAVEFDPKELRPDEDTLARLEARIANRYGGEHNAARPMFVPPGAKIQPLWVTPKELDFKGSFEQLRDSILALYGVPPVVAGITKNMTYGSVLAAQAGFCQFVVNPLLAMLGQAITETVAAAFDPRLRVWWPDLTPTDPAVLEKQIATDLSAEAITPDEVRALRGRAPRADGNGGEVIPSRLRPPPGPAVPPAGKKPAKKPGEKLFLNGSHRG